MKNLLEIATSRFSVRSYTNSSVSRDLILKILEAGRIAPSAVNYQPWHFVVVDDESTKVAIQESYPRDWFKQAPVYIVICADYNKAWVRNSDQKSFADVDATIAAEHIILQATELGLGSCWVCNFDVAKCKQALKLPKKIEPLVIIPIGFTAETTKVKNRKPMEELVHWNSFKSL